MRIGKSLLFGLALSLTGAAAPGEDARSPARGAAMTDSEKEHFLLKAEIVRRKAAPGGRTLSRQVTLSLEGYEHDAHVQTIDVAKSVEPLKSGPEFDFRDSYRNNVAAYRLDRLLGLGMAPVTVFRHYDLKPASFMWWVDDVLMDLGEQTKKKVRPPHPVQWNCQVFTMRALDRNQGNLLIDESWWVWMIDHSRAFKVFGDLRSEKELGPILERRFFAGLKDLDEPTLRAAMEDLLVDDQIEGLLERRDKIVAYYEARIAQLGEGILCDLAAPSTAPESP
jgi:hypothetical protein